MRKLCLFVILIALCSAIFAQTYGETGVGTTSTNLPIYSLWGYSWSSAIYPASAFGGQRNITSLAWNHINTVNSTMNNQKIYLKESSQATFSSNNYDDPLANGFTLVYNGPVTTVTGWTIIDITDFNYSGNANLIVHWENRSGQSNYTTNWNGTDCTAGVIKCAGSDTAFPASAGWAPYPLALPNLRFYYATNNPATPANPSPAMNETAVSLNRPLSFSLGANTTGYQILLGTSPDALTSVATQQISSPGVYSYTPSVPWQASTTYYWKVTASNGSGSSTGPLWNFTTEGLVTSLPYSVGFEGATFPPAGWLRSSEAWTQANYPHTGNSCAKVSYVHTDPAILRTPRIQLPANPVRLRFFWCDSDDISRVAGHDSTYVEISSDLGQTWNVLGVLSAPSYQSSYQEFTADLNSYINQTVYLRWRDVTDGSLYAYGALIDDLLLEPISVNPVISISPATLAFPETGAGIPISRNITISNLGSSPLSFTGTTPTGPFSCPTPTAIAPSQTLTIPITYLPANAGNHTGSISFNINGTFTGNNLVNLSGSAYTPLSTFFENFDAGTALPTHWSAYEDGTNQYTGVQVRVSAFDAYSGTNSVRMFNSAEDTLGVNILLISPALSDLSANTLTFFAKSSWGIPTDTMILGYLSDPSQPSTFTAVQTIPLTANYVQYTHNFSQTGSAHYVAFKHGLGDGQNYGIYLDDIGWEASGNVPNPATAIFPAPAATEVRLDYIGKKLSSRVQWSGGGGNPTGYRFYFGTSNGTFDLINGTDLGLVDTLTVSQSLNYNTTYYWKVVPYNASGNAVNCPVWSFTTMPDPTRTVTIASPFTEGFESAAVGTIPLGWELDNLDNDTAYWTAIGNSTSSQNAHTGNRAVHVSFSFMTQHDDWLYSPPLALTAGTQYNISFWYKSIDFPGDVCIEKLELKWGTLPNPQGMLSTLFYNENIVSPIPYTQFTGTLTPTVDGIYFLGFHCFSDPMQFVLLVDDISLSVGSAVQDDNVVPAMNGLNNAYPNPFRDETTVKYSVSGSVQTEISVYNLRGQKVRSLVSGRKTAGDHSVLWDGKDDLGKPVSSGVYYIRMHAGKDGFTRKVVLTR